MDEQWDLTATFGGITAVSIDDEFLASMTANEFNHFFAEVDKLENLCAKEKYKRSRA
jgi:hypothetical protein